MPNVWVHIGLPVVLWLVLYLSEARSVREDAKRADNQFRRALIRQLEAIEEDQVRIVGKIVAPDGGSVNLGNSTEQPEKISGNPELEGESFVVEANDGRRFRLRPGLIRIERLPGAERKLVRTVTTESGVEQTYSFEVPDGFEVMVVGRASESAEGAFRDGPIDLAPLDDGFRLGADLIDARKPPKLRKVDTAKNASIFGALFALASVGVGYIPYLGALLWFPAMLVMAMIAFVFLFGTSSVEPLRTDEEARLEALKVRVQVDEDESAEVQSDTERVELEAEV